MFEHDKRTMLDTSRKSRTCKILIPKLKWSPHLGQVVKSGFCSWNKRERIGGAGHETEPTMRFSSLSYISRLASSRWSGISWRAGWVAEQGAAACPGRSRAPVALSGRSAQVVGHQLFRTVLPAGGNLSGGPDSSEAD